MRDGEDGADVLTGHAGNVAYLVDGDGVEWTDEASRLRAHSYAGTAVDAGVPTDVEDDGGVLLRGQLLN